MTTETIECYLPLEQEEDKYNSPELIEFHKGTLDIEELAAFEATKKLVEEAKLKVNSALN